MAVVGSPWITADFTTPSQCRDLRRYARCEFSVADLFRRQEHHARKLQHSGKKLQANPSEEWPERAEQGDVIRLQENGCPPESRE